MTKILYAVSWILLGVMLLQDAILSPGRSPSERILPGSKAFQTILDLNTKILHGKGVSAAIVSETQGSWSGASGISYPGKAVDAEMVFNIASIGKNFLAATIVQLAEEGKLSLDDPISKWGLGDANIDETISVRQLLNHTSGIYDWVTHRRSPFNIPYRQIDTTRAWTQEEVLDQLTGKPYFPPGGGWHYSTTNYNLLRMIAEKVTGKPASQEIQARFLGPLGLEHVVALEADGQGPAGLETAHGWLDVDGDGELEDIGDDSQVWIASMSPHMMVASALDLARWSQALYGGRVLSQASLEQVLDFHRPTPDEPPVTGYGLGTEEVAVKGVLQAHGHLGYHYGFMSAMLYFPKMKASLVVLTNENNQPFQYGVSFSLLIALALVRARYYLCVAVIVLLSIVFFRKRKVSKRISRKYQ